jgi:uncharacterized protein
MPRKPPRTTPAQRQKAYRERLRERGLASYQVYIDPVHKPVLDAVEKALRHPSLPTLLHQLTLEHLSPMTIAWNTQTLHQALQDTAESAAWTPTVHGDAVHLTLSEHGDLPVDIAVAGSQIFASAVLFPASQVTDRAAFNEAALKVSPLTSLTSIGILTIGGEDVYVAYGQLSACAPADNIVEEIRTLGHNALEFVSLFSSHIGA